MMNQFEFLLCTWTLKYNVPDSSFSKAMKGTGLGTFQRFLEDRFVRFDYHGRFKGQRTEAHGIFGWDENRKIIRYWWFESSGAFMSASCKFLDDSTLCMNWHDSVLVQTFRKMSQDKVILHMTQPDAEGKQELLLEVILKRR